MPADAALPDAALADAALPDATPPDAEPPPKIFVYWVNTTGTVGRVNVDDNTDAGDVASGLIQPFAVAVDPDNDKIYYGGGTATITQADLDGSNATGVVPTGEAPYGMTIDTVNDKIYWSEFGGDRVMRADLDGSNAEPVIEAGINDPSGIWVDTQNQKVYVIEYNNTALRRANLDGTGLETVASSLGGQGVSVIVDPDTQRIFYSLRGSEVRVMDLDGSNQGTFVGGQSLVQGMAVDFVAGKLYWSSAGVIRRADLADGGNVEDVYDTGVNAWHLSILPTPAP